VLEQQQVAEQDSITPDSHPDPRNTYGFLAESECNFAVQEIVAISDASQAKWHEFLIRPRGKYSWLPPELMAKVQYRRVGFRQTDRAIISLGMQWLAGKEGMDQLSLNVHPESLIESDFKQWLYAEIQQYSLQPEQLVLEIIEFADNTPLFACAAGLRDLKADGVKIALDDYGVGSTNIALLADGCIDFVKIDRSIGQVLAERPDHQKLLRNIQAMVVEMGGQLVVEGVETETQLEAAKNCQVDWVQGFLFARPRDIDSVTTDKDGNENQETDQSG